MNVICSLLASCKSHNEDFASFKKFLPLKGRVLLGRVFWWQSSRRQVTHRLVSSRYFRNFVSSSRSDLGNFKSLSRISSRLTRWWTLQVRSLNRFAIVLKQYQSGTKGLAQNFNFFLCHPIWLQCIKNGLAFWGSVPLRTLFFFERHGRKQLEKVTKKSKIVYYSFYRMIWFSQWKASLKSFEPS